MREVWHLYRVLVSGSIRSRMQYKFNFIFMNLAYAIIFLVEFVGVGALLYRFGTIAGWTIYEIALLFGISGVAMGLVRTFASELVMFEMYIIQGDFDSLLIRPWSTLLILATRSLDFGRLGAVLQGVAITLLGARYLIGTGQMSPWALLYLPLICLTGALLYLALVLATSAFAFWVHRTDELMTFTVHAPSSAGTYPLTIYPRWLQAILFTVLPVAYIHYLPLRFLIGKGGSWLSLLAPLGVAPLALACAFAIWRVGERRYQSTGN